MVRREDICLDDIDFSTLEAQFKVEETFSFTHIMVIDGLPVIDASKEHKVVAILKKVLFDKVGAFLKSPDAVYFVKNEVNVNTG